MAAARIVQEYGRPVYPRVAMAEKIDLVGPPLMYSIEAFISQKPTLAEVSIQPKAGFSCRFEVY